MAGWRRWLGRVVGIPRLRRRWASEAAAWLSDRLHKRAVARPSAVIVAGLGWAEVGLVVEVFAFDSIGTGERAVTDEGALLVGGQKRRLFESCPERIAFRAEGFELVEVGAFKGPELLRACWLTPRQLPKLDWRSISIRDAQGGRRGCQ